MNHSSHHVTMITEILFSFLIVSLALLGIVMFANKEEIGPEQSYFSWSFYAAVFGSALFMPVLVPMYEDITKQQATS